MPTYTQAGFAVLHSNVGSARILYEPPQLSTITQSYPQPHSLFLSEDHQQQRRKRGTGHIHHVLLPLVLSSVAQSLTGSNRATGQRCCSIKKVSSFPASFRSFLRAKHGSEEAGGGAPETGSPPRRCCSAATLILCRIRLSNLIWDSLIAGDLRPVETPSRDGVRRHARARVM